MKNYKLILFVALLFAACKNKTASNDDVQSIKFKFTELGRETQFRITCDKFDYYFPEGKEKHFDKKPGIDSVMQLLSGMKMVNDGTEPDVRGKIYITHAVKVVDTVCVGVKALSYKGTTYETPQQLLVLIQK
jgi:PBP1b-binding outer membrane lipoprotein LpoB